jgi:hypothetical protein
MSDEQAGSGAARSADLMSQLQQILTQLTTMPMRMPGEMRPLVGDMPTLSRPGTLSASQMSGLSSTIRAQRKTIEALQAQLVAFDDQLAVLEQLIEPLAQLADSWAILERGVLGEARGRDQAP